MTSLLSDQSRHLGSSEIAESVSKTCIFLKYYLHIFNYFMDYSYRLRNHSQNFYGLYMLEK